MVIFNKGDCLYGSSVGETKEGVVGSVYELLSLLGVLALFFGNFKYLNIAAVLEAVGNAKTRCSLFAVYKNLV